MTAMVQGGGNNPTLYKTQVPKPKPGSHQLLVKVSHVAQNPTDSKKRFSEIQRDVILTLIVLGLDSNRFGDGAILGCDFVGVVEEVGKDVTRRRQGDVIAGLVRGGDLT
jgi:NADPH:quinone reductase-like Zn-dependent oxidoreductase